MSEDNIFNGYSFGVFFQVWLARQQDYLNQLLFLSSQNHPGGGEELKSLVGQVLSHYQHYYEAKARVTQGDVFLLFSPPWFSTFERSFLWMAGFKPTLAFTILDKSVGGELTAAQVEQVQRLKVETRMMEKMLNEEMLRIQESIVTPSWMQVVMRREGEARYAEMDQIMELSRDRFRTLVFNADYLRTTTARELVEILGPVQAAKFLVATARLQLKVRALGLQKDADSVKI